MHTKFCGFLLLLWLWTFACFPFLCGLVAPGEVSLAAVTDCLQPGETRVETEDQRVLVCGSLLSWRFLSSILLCASLQPFGLRS